MEWLRNYIDKYELTDALPEDVENVAAKEAIVKNFEKEHETLLKQRESLFDFLEQGIYTKEIFIERSNALERRVKECMEHIISAQNDLHATLALQANRKNFVPRCKNLLGEWGRLTIPEKNSALKVLIEKIMFTKTKRNKKGQKLMCFQKCRNSGVFHSLHLLRAKELAHMEMVCAIVYQLTKDLSPEEIERSGFAPYYVDHTLALWPQAASGAPWTATYFQSKGDPITDLHEDLAAEQKARTTYDNILRLVKDPEVCDPIRFLRQREIVHYQRFGESLRIVQEKLDSKNFYAVNPEFDK